MAQDQGGVGEIQRAGCCAKHIMALSKTFGVHCFFVIDTLLYVPIENLDFELSEPVRARSIGRK